MLAAVVLLAWSATSVVTALGARWLPARVSPRALLVAELVGCAAGQLAPVGLDPGNSIRRLLPGLLVAGAANGVLNAALGRQAVASVPADRAAMGSGANNTARYVGSGIGITIVTVLLTRPGAAPGAVGLLSGWNVAVVVTVAFSLLGARRAARPRARLAGPEPNPSPSRPRRASRVCESIQRTTKDVEHMNDKNVRFGADVIAAADQKVADLRDLSTSLALNDLRSTGNRR